MNNFAEIGIIGGTGTYNIELESKRKINIKTPYGKTSDLITLGKYKKKKIAFIPRHGKKHSIPPHLINFRANIWAYKKLKIQRIIAISAVGSLKKNIRPGDMVLPTQFLDFTKSRDKSFSEIGNVIHISVAYPFCPELQKITSKIIDNNNIRTHKNCVYTCIEGPRFSTLAESKFFQSIGGDIIGMTVVPECQLAREAQICYLSIATVTDYDTLFKKTVTAKAVANTLSKSSQITKKIIESVITNTPTTKKCNCEKELLAAKF